VTKPVAWCTALEAEYRALHGSPAIDGGAPSDPDRLAAVHARIHEHPTTALCLSGGGIRSATFALGVLQGLATVGILGKLDYLSTVSGGGYIGGWFTAWLHRILVRCVYRAASLERRQAAVRALDVGGDRPVADSGRALEDRDEVDRGFRRLKPELRAALVVHHYLGLTHEEAAEVLGVPVGTVKSRLNRATSAMRAELQAEARGRERMATETIR